MYFYSHAHEGRDATLYRYMLVHLHFYSHAHEGRDLEVSVMDDKEQNFYSHAHEGRDDYWDFRDADKWISTHTPTRGVTVPHQKAARSYQFLLTRPRGA